ncbi:MAG TPA: methyltransferase domain-containing protein [Bacteroidia bacterium]|jgi:ubiquinone/menaquinone biosynthesis C-methylase UbiE
MSSERQDHNENTPWWGEHIHRYQVAYPYLKEEDKVLDIACGNGFGSYLLSRKTKGMVTGGDISAETVEICRNRYKGEPNLEFRVIDGTAVNYPNGYFDMVVSFETIEHTTEYIKMLQEFYRTVKQGGTVLISTPNKAVTSPDGIIKNPYHTQEFTLEQLQALLNSVFDDVKISGQQYTRYSKGASFTDRIGQIVERMLYSRGIRKLPLSFQNKLMNAILKKDLYPSPADFGLTDDIEEILKCTTLLAVCKKK